jgi:hypothetical protein
MPRRITADIDDLRLDHSDPTEVPSPTASASSTPCIAGEQNSAPPSDLEPRPKGWPSDHIGRRSSASARSARQHCFYPDAMNVALELEGLDEVERYAQALEDFANRSPGPISSSREERASSSIKMRSAPPTSTPITFRLMHSPFRTKPLPIRHPHRSCAGKTVHRAPSGSTTTT